MEIDREELAWAAGFFDGEGHTQLTKQGYVSLKVAQTGDERECLERFRAAVGCGRIYGPYTNISDGAIRRRYFIWQLQRFELTQAVMAALWPFLSPPKREQAAAAFRSRKPKAVYPRQETCRYGHDLSVYRTFNKLGQAEGCAECGRRRAREYQARKRLARP